MSAPDDFRRAPLPVDLDRLLHDLRGPLNAVVMHLEVLKRLAGDQAPVRASLQSINQELERLTAMLPLAFAVSALEIDARRPVPLRSVVESAIDDSVRKRVHVEEGPWPKVDGDERLLVLALRQLIANACEAGGEESEVRIGVTGGVGDVVTVEVRDAGSGFKTRNPNAVVRLMASTKPGHAGIGLLVAQRVARLHGGTLTFETTPGGGVVRLSLKV